MKVMEVRLFEKDHSVVAGRRESPPEAPEGPGTKDVVAKTELLT